MNVPNFIRRKWAYEMKAGIYDKKFFLQYDTCLKQIQMNI